MPITFCANLIGVARVPPRCWRPPPLCVANYRERKNDRAGTSGGMVGARAGSPGKSKKKVGCVLFYFSLFCVVLLFFLDWEREATHIDSKVNI